MTTKTFLSIPALKKTALLWLALGTLIGCAGSQEYLKALESGERPWARCGVSMLPENGERLEGGLMNVYLLKKEEKEEEDKDKNLIKIRKIWLEGHMEIVDFDGEKWKIYLEGSNQIFSGTQEIDGETIKREAGFCFNKVSISGQHQNYSSAPASKFACIETEPQIFPEFRVQLLNNKGRWFRMDLKCERNTIGRGFN